MTEGIKWTLAGVIAILISILGALIVLKFGSDIPKEDLKWIIGIYVAVLMVLWAGFVRAIDAAERKKKERYIDDMKNKADRTLTDSRFKEQQIIITDFKEKNEAQINGIHEFMASIDSNMKSVDSKLEALNSYLLNKKR